MFFSAFLVHRGSVGNSRPRTCFSISIKEKQFKPKIQYAVLTLVGRRGYIPYLGKSLNEVMVFEKEFSSLQLRVKKNVGEQKLSDGGASLNIKLLDRRIVTERMIGRFPMPVHSDLNDEISLEQGVLVGQLTIEKYLGYLKCIVVILQKGSVNHLWTQVQMPE